jgi:hypothetical protein
MRKLLLILTAGLLIGPAIPSEATSERRSGLERNPRVGRVQLHLPQQGGLKPIRPFGAWKEGSSKRCPECRRAERSRVGAGGPSVPEPSGALLFGLGALALRSRLSARGSR